MNSFARMAAMAATEFRLAIRNRWVLLATVMLTLFALALGLLGSGPGGPVKADALSLTAAGLATLSVYLIPLIALLLSYDTVAGEMERGTLALVLATPASRWELLAGKSLAHLGVLSSAVVIGYGVAALAIVAAHGLSIEGLLAWGRLIGTGILLGAVFIGIGVAVSAAVARTGTAAALVIGIWLVLVVLYDLALLAGLIVDNGGFFTTNLFPILVIANPGDAFRLFNMAALEASAPVASIDGLARTLPFPPNLALGMLAVWLAATFGAGLFSIRRLRP